MTHDEQITIALDESLFQQIESESSRRGVPIEDFIKEIVLSELSDYKG